jgi:hypothetical protein
VSNTEIHRRAPDDLPPDRSGNGVLAARLCLPTIRSLPKLGNYFLYAARYGGRLAACPGHEAPVFQSFAGERQEFGPVADARERLRPGGRRCRSGLEKLV